MAAQLLFGKSLSQKIAHQLQQTVEKHARTGARPPHLSIILIGEHPASLLYIQRKIALAKRIGIQTTLHQFAENVEESKIFLMLDDLNKNKNIDGILIQLPLPLHFSKEKILEAIDPHKDVDGLHPYNLGRLAAGYPFLRPCTPYGIIRLLQHQNINLKGAYTVVLGASALVGRPMMLELLLTGSTVTLCHSKTISLEKFIREADILISATGKKHLVNPDWIKKDAVIIDVGIHRLPNGNICGDLDHELFKEKARFVTPVPGGVGPMTVAILMENVLRARGFLS